MVNCPKCGSEDLIFLEMYTAEKTYMKDRKWFKDILELYECKACEKVFSVVIDSYEIKWFQA